MVNSAKPSFFDLFWFLLCRTCQEKKFRAFTSCPPTKSQRRREKQGAWTAFAMCPARKLCRSSREPQGPPGQSSLLASASRPPPTLSSKRLCLPEGSLQCREAMSLGRGFTGPESHSSTPQLLPGLGHMAHMLSHEGFPHSQCIPFSFMPSPDRL